jgi:PAS domain-containing protein
VTVRADADRDAGPDDVYRAAFQASPVFCVLTNRRGIILDANRAASSFLNVPHAVLVSRPLINFVARGDTRAFRGRVGELSKTHTTLFELTLRPRSARPRRVEMRVVILPPSWALWCATGIGPNDAPPARG